MVALVLACSGGSDVGEVADRAARAVARSGAVKMYCLAGVGGKLPSMVKFAGEAEEILAIDGCPQNCAQHCLKNAGIAKFQHLRLAEIGMVKGQTPPSEEAVARAASHAASLLESDAK